MLHICDKGKKRKVRIVCSETVAKRKFTKKTYILETPLYSSDSKKKRANTVKKKKKTMKKQTSGIDHMFVQNG